ncbi:hypothetical protein [Ruegeria sediminis]|uniref:hypothetical protein n=1 Tax=Ruegeria sediminis TaxID=2583820 RepID=UPI001486374D|nr:hypothetical protein [Ruegeria sediminis]
MTWFRMIAGFLAFFPLMACEPGNTGQGSGASQADYERHKANREAYMYQGF